MKIAGYLKTSLIEWPGKISCVIFTPGCNFRCPFCHNRDLVDPKKTTKLPKIAEKEVFTDLKKRGKWIDGVVVSGGEPTLQPGLDNFFKKIKQRGFLTMLETNGSKSEVLKGLFKRKLIDRITMDIKGPLDKRYNGIANCELRIEEIKNSIELIVNSGIEFEFRTTVVPGMHDGQILTEMAEQIKPLLQNTPGNLQTVWFLQIFQPKNCLDPKFDQLKPLERMIMENYQQILRKVIPRTQLR
jgi:pyruvate formate lyase activating enzyme